MRRNAPQVAGAGAGAAAVSSSSSSETSSSRTSSVSSWFRHGFARGGNRRANTRLWLPSTSTSSTTTTTQQGGLLRGSSVFGSACTASSFWTTVTTMKVFRIIVAVAVALLQLHLLLFLLFSNNRNGNNNNNNDNPATTATTATTTPVSWQASDAPRGFAKSQSLVQAPREQALQDTYLTLWLHQVHRWFETTTTTTTSNGAGGKDSKTQVREFLEQAKAVGFTSVMGDLPFEWTEREAQGQVDIYSFSKDWMKIACELGLGLHIVISMRDLPPWAKDMATTDDWFEQAWSLDYGRDVTVIPSAAHATVWRFMQNYTQSVTRHVLDAYGSCVHTISPTFNNEFETRFVQTRDAMRDFNPAVVALFRQWQVHQKLATSVDTAKDPPILPVTPQCHALQDDFTWAWFAFREEYLADRYDTLCRLVHESWAGTVQQQHQNLQQPKCLLHFGEFFSTVDRVISNLFFRLAQSPHVDELVMDSNMALSGGPSSPSVPGILTSTANLYGKRVHFEIATERIFACDDQGHVKSHQHQDWDQQGPLLLRTGIDSSLAAGVKSLGVTNLCSPKLAGDLFEFFATGDNVGVMHTALPFRPTAVIYAPYRAFWGWFDVVAGASCNALPLPCWHESFESMPQFKWKKKVGGGTSAVHSCVLDVAQDALIQLYDELRTRHAHVAVVGDVDMLTDDLLRQTTNGDRYVLTFPCLTDRNGPFKFYGGAETWQTFEAKRKRFSFHEHRVDALAPSSGTCPV